MSSCTEAPPRQKAAADLALIHQHFATVYATCEGVKGVVAVYGTNGDQKPRNLRFFGNQDFGGMADHSLKLAEKYDVFHTVNLIDPAAVPEIQKRHGRGNADEVSAVVGYYVDADAEKPSSEKRYPPWAILNDAIEAMPLQPTLVNASGGGLHVFTLFQEPVEIDGDDARGRQGGLCKGWQALLAKRLHGYDMDSTADLVRVLRPGGTINHKYGVVVQPVVFEPNRRHDPVDFEQFVSVGNQSADAGHAPAPTQAPATAPSTSAPDDDEIVLAAAGNAINGHKFDRLMAGDTRGYKSASEADLALATRLVFWCGDKPEQIERIMRRSKLVRPKWDERREAGTYLSETIAKALTLQTERYTWRGKANGRAKPQIDAASDDLPLVTRLAWDAITQANHPERMFRFGGRIVRAESGDEGEVVLQDVSLDRMRYEVAEAAFWFRYRKKGKGEQAETVQEPASPADKIVRNVLATPDPDLPCLTRIVEAPVFGPDGSILTQAGYHPASRTYYAPAAGLAIPPIPQRPTTEDVARAVRLLTVDLLGDFPFVSDAERANAVALLLLPFVRDMIDGATPLHLVEKPSPGTGATLLVDLLAFPATGHPLSALTEGRDEDEWRKRVTAALRSGATHLLIDNLKGRLDSAALSSAITAPTWTDRLLGSSTMVRTPVRCCWAATGNNPLVSTEIARRTVRIRLDAKQDRPWMREGFRHPDIRQWARDHRGDLIAAALTLGRAWISAGRPKGGIRLGMFESWAETMGGILDVARVPGFLTNTSEFYEEADAEGNAIREFVAAWWDTFQAEEVGVAELFGVLPEDGFESLTGADGQSDRARRTRLGLFLTKHKDRVFDLGDELLLGGEYHHAPKTVRLEAGSRRRRAQLWKLRGLG